MSVSKQVRARIEKIGSEAIFGLKDFQEIENPQAVILELSRLSKKGVIKRLSKGKYFVPRLTRFGELGPSEWQVLTKLIQENGGYFSDAMALNRLGVTTQVPSEIVIRGARSTRKAKVGNLSIQFLAQGNPEARVEDSKLTDIIEGIRLINRTPDGNVSLSISRILESFKDLNSTDREKLIKLSLKERPYVRAVLGAVIEPNDFVDAEKLKESLNPVTKYRIGISKKILPNKEKWGID